MGGYFNHKYVSGIPTFEFTVPKGELLRLEQFFQFTPHRWGKRQQVNQCVRLRKPGTLQQRQPI